MADGKITIEIEARDTGLTAALEQARQKAQQAASAMSQQAAAALTSSSAISALASQLGRLNIAGQLTSPMLAAASASAQMQSGVTGNLGSVQSALRATASQASGWAGTVGSAMTAAQSAAGRTVTALSALQTAMGQTGKAAGTMTTGVRQQSSAVQTAISQLVTAAVNRAKNAAAQFRQAGAQYAGNLAGGMNQGRNGVQSSATALVSAGLGPWNGARGQFQNAGLAASGAAAAGISGGTGGMQQAASAAASAAQSAMNIGGWYSVGYNISAGVASGVYGGSSLITAAARTAAQNALAAAKRSLGVHSPSRVFRDQVGAMIPAGMAQGIAMATPQAQKAVELSAQTLRDTGRAALNPSGGGVMETVAAGERSAAQTTAQFTGNVVLEAPLYLDGREIARASAKYTGRQMAYLEGL